MDFRRTTRRLPAGIATIALAAALVPGAASAQGSPQQDPLNEAKSMLLCKPQGSILRPTQVCSVYDPASETYHNPYTANGDSPGVFGLGVLGLL